MAESYRRFKPWELVTPQEWNDWKWQIRNRITNLRQLSGLIKLTKDEKEAMQSALCTHRMAITPYFFSLIDLGNPHDPIRKQAIPTIQELHLTLHDMRDPLEENVDSPAPGLTYRYPDRVLLLVTDQCPMYCRYCTRRRREAEKERAHPLEWIKEAISYIREKPQIRDVLLSGGEPLMLSTARLEQIIQKIRAIPHVEIIRIGTRVPCVLPQRIDDELITMLKKYHPLYINTHFNHPLEFTPESTAALAKIADAGFPLGNQTVLLRGINDDPEVMKKLMHLLLKHRVKPYYIYQCDLSRGIGHFRTPVRVGIQIMESLRGHTSGIAVPTYVVDAPGGGGKIPVMPSYLISRGYNRVILRNYEGVIVSYPEPADYIHCPENYRGEIDSLQKSTEGIISLMTGDDMVIEPKNLDRRRSQSQLK
jgi:lysine 2,3-aminomutase